MGQSEWMIAAGFLLVPLGVFGAIELAGQLRRRRERARAQRSKARPQVR